MSLEIPPLSTMYEDGTGFYSKYNVVHREFYKVFLPMALHVIDKVTFGGGSFVICDYGAADGGTSMELLTKAIGLLKEKYGDKQPVRVVYVDQPTHDFRVLFKRLNGMLAGPASYLSLYPGVYPSTMGTSFFNQCLPDNSVHFGLSSTAFQWLSERPCIQKNSLYFSIDDADAEEKSVFVDMAAKDWVNILLHRSRELAPGGHMLISCPGTDPEGRFGGQLSFLTLFNSLWREMLLTEMISKEEFLSINFDEYVFRTEEDFIAPFKDPRSEVLQSGLRLVSVQWVRIECPIRALWLEQKAKGMSARQHGVNFAKSIKSWAYNTIKEGLASNRNEREKDHIVNTFFDKMEDKVAASPDDHGMEYVNGIVHVKKEHD